MSGSNDGSGSKDGSESWGYTFLKVAGAAAATVVAGALVAALSSSSAAYEQGVAFGAQCEDKERDDGGRILQEKWKKPEIGWLKLNVDGSRDHNEPSAGCGGVLRDSSGKWILGFSMKLDPNIYNKPNETELQAILTGLELAREMNVKKLVVESDNESAVSVVENGLGFKFQRSEFDIVQRIRKLRFDPEWQVKLVCVPRNANRVANCLAKAARKLSCNDLCKYHSAPGNCSHLVSEDNLGTNNNEMSGSNDGSGSKDGSKDGSKSWGSMFLKVAAGAAAATVVVGGALVALAALSSSSDDGGRIPCSEKWKKPEIGSWKLNVDGSLDHNGPSAGCGGVLRDSSGKWLLGFSMNLDPKIYNQPHKTELQAILMGLKLATEMNVKKPMKLVVESDSESVVSMVENGLGNKGGPAFDIVRRIKDLCKGGPAWQVTVIWVPRKANRVANWLANDARKLSFYTDPLNKYDDIDSVRRRAPTCYQIWLEDNEGF